ncbi:MAG: AtpZ/AtpI family protein [Pelosinus sp.]|nr:AtpZ/AtpI family protein [Pelosinus sp.]
MNDKDKRELFAAFGLVSSIGFQLAAAIGVGLFAGRFFDEFMNTAPAATILGIILGIFTGGWAMYKRIMGR